MLSRQGIGPQVLVLGLIAVSCVLPGHGSACTAYLLERGDERGVCRNYDFNTGEAMLLVNPRGLVKIGLPQRNPAHWTAKHGSVTVNQCGRELPVEGMNEAGLVVAALWLDETELPADTTKPAITSLQWIQFMLDQAATVAEVLALDETIVTVPGAGSTIHYLVADASGDEAVVEYLDGKRIHHQGGGFGVAAIANDTYEASSASLGRYKPFGGPEDLPTDMSSLARFCRAARYRARFASEPERGLVDFGFASLASVSSGMATQWSVVYDQRRRRVWLRSQRNQELRSVELKALDFAPTRPASMLPIDAGDGDITTSFVPYTTQANRDLIWKVFGQIEFLKEVPDDAKEALARFPESLVVAGAER